MRKHLERIKDCRKRRTFRVRRRLQTAQPKLRLSVNKSNKHIFAQIIDDETNRTLCSVGTYSKEFRSTEFNKKNKASAKKIGEKIAALAKENEIQEVVFDRGRSKYHGILAELADAARAGGLQF